MSGAADVRALIAAATRVARDPSLVPRLAASTGLSPENVACGLTRHLETDATTAEIDTLVRRAGRAECVAVLLSSSVFVAPLRALALALAASDRVVVKPSRLEPVFARALVAALDDPRVTLDPDLDVAGIASGEIHVYGRDETIDRVRLAARPTVIVRAHGPGMGIALVTRDFANAAAALAEDIAAFDQRGCLSPRVAFVTGDAHAFAGMLFDALEAHGTRIPRGPLDRTETESVARWSSTVAYAGTLRVGASCAVAVSDALALPPPGRHILVRPLPTPDALVTTLGEATRLVIALGTDLSPFTLPHARHSLLGAMQRPPLDGPVDLRNAT